MSSLLSQKQRDLITEAYREISPNNELALVRLFIDGSDKQATKQAVKFNKRMTSLGMGVAGDEVIMFIDSSKRGNGKDGFSLTNSHFHTSIGIGSSGEVDLIHRLPYNCIKEMCFKGENTPNSVGRMILKMDLKTAKQSGIPQIEFSVTKATSDILKRVIEIIQVNLPKEEQSQHSEITSQFISEEKKTRIIEMLKKHKKHNKLYVSVFDEIDFNKLNVFKMKLRKNNISADEEEIISFESKTFMRGSGREGILITNKHIYIVEPLETPIVVKIAEIKSMFHAYSRNMRDYRGSVTIKIDFGIEVSFECDREYFKMYEQIIKILQED